MYGANHCVEHSSISQNRDIYSTVRGLTTNILNQSNFVSRDTGFGAVLCVVQMQSNRVFIVSNAVSAQFNRICTAYIVAHISKFC